MSAQISMPRPLAGFAAKRPRGPRRPLATTWRRGISPRTLCLPAAYAAWSRARFPPPPQFLPIKSNSYKVDLLLEEHWRNIDAFFEGLAPGDRPAQRILGRLIATLAPLGTECQCGFSGDVEQDVAVEEDGQRSPRGSARISSVVIRTDPWPRRLLWSSRACSWPTSLGARSQQIGRVLPWHRDARVLRPVDR